MAAPIANRKTMTNREKISVECGLATLILHNSRLYHNLIIAVIDHKDLI